MTDLEERLIEMWGYSEILAEFSKSKTNEAIIELQRAAYNKWIRLRINLKYGLPFDF